MQLFYCPDISGKNIELPTEEAQHCLRVLRKEVGDTIQLTDGKGFFYEALITGSTGKHCSVEILSSTVIEKPWKGHLHLALAPTKNMDRMEWLVEKATEIGVDEISFLHTRYSERKVIKTERIEKIVLSAMKQSLKAELPVVHEMVDFHRFLQTHTATQRFIAHCQDLPKKNLVQIPTADSSILLIGPEGDFSTEEIERALSLGYEGVSLSDSRLRTETAALVGLHTLHLKGLL